jgi:Cu2+-exporting ATPase
MEGVCAHCGLPLGRRPVVVSVAGVPGRFCCYGCVLAQQVTRARGEGGAAAALVVRLGLGVFFAVNVMMVSMPTYAPVVYGAAVGDGPLFVVLRVLALLLAAPVLILLGVPLARTVRGPDTNALILLGTLAAYGLSVVNTIEGRPAVYFDTAAMLLVLVTLGRYLEASARTAAGAAVAATLAPGPAFATRFRADGGREQVEPAALRVGDEVEVGPGGAFPTDAAVLAGTGGVDEAALTGESRPVLKEAGSAVAGGTCSVDGVFRLRVTAAAAASAAARVEALLAAARAERAPVERVADRVAARLVPLVVALALAAGGWWTWRVGLDRGILVALAVLVVACPCGLGIATPAAIWAGLAVAARRGVVIRSAAVLERAAAIGRVVFDKTGTLTDAMPWVLAVEPAAGSGMSAADILARAAALEAGLTHPLARAVTAAAAAAGVDVPAAAGVRVAPGLGVRGEVGGQPLAVGNARLAAEELPAALMAALGRHDAGHVFVIGAGRLLGTLRMAEAPRPEAGEAVAALRRLGVRVGLLTGDATASAVVPALVAPGDAAVGLLPADKVAHLRALRAMPGAIAMVGDGVNDAPALAAADVGIAIGNATDLARLTADVLVLGGDLRAVPWLVAHARRVDRVIRQNLAWAFAYNVVAVALAAAGCLNPLMASLAMLGSSGAVVANTRRLRHD